MLITKKTLHRLNFLKKQHYIFNLINYQLIYCYFKNYSNILFGSLIYLALILKKKKEVSFIYNIKMTSPNYNTLVVRTQHFLNFVNRFKMFKSMKTNYFKKKSKKYTLLRSPFVYSKSREQLHFIINKCQIVLVSEKSNIFFATYIDLSLKKLVKNMYNAKSKIIKYFIDFV